MTKILADNVCHVVTNPIMINSDILGNCYHEFISYGGGDGSDLVIVLTPEHVTTLMADMVDVNATDYLVEAILPGLLQVVGSSYSLVARVVQIGSRWLSPGCRDEACIALLKVEAFCFAIFVFIPVNDQLKPATSPHC